MLLLKKRGIIIIILVILLSSIVSAAEICYVSQVKTSLKTALYGFLTNPSEFDALTVSEIKELLVFYITIGGEEVTTVCTDKIMDIMDQVGGIPISTCSDGTEYGECSSLKPEYCFAGNIVDRCDICGCDNQLCDNITGECQETELTIKCNVDSDCGTEGYVGDVYCSGDNITKNYVKHICNDANTVDSDCADETTPVVTKMCEFGCSKGECVAQEDIVYVDSCRELNERGKYFYRLTRSITGVTGTCFTSEEGARALDLGGHYIILDLGGHSIIGDGTGYGVYVNGHNGITIKNGEVNNFYNGVYIESSYTTLTDITANSNSQNGIYLSIGSLYNTLTDITANSNSQDGIYLSSSSNNDLLGITANLNTKNGIRLDSSSDNTLLNILTSSNQGMGIKGSCQGGILLFSGSKRNTLTNINSDSNNNGICIIQSSENIVQDSDLSSNRLWLGESNGLATRYSDDTIIRRTIANNNGNDGFHLRYSYRTIVRDNTAIGNYDDGIDQEERYLEIYDNYLCGHTGYKHYDLDCKNSLSPTGSGNTCTTRRYCAGMCTYSCP